MSKSMTVTKVKRGFKKNKYPIKRVFANDTTAYRPEVWANEAVRILWEEMVYAGMVHRDFEDEVSEYGEVVNTRKPGTFTASRKQNDLDAVVDQDATATKIQVKLNQRLYVSFMLGDGERTKAFQDLVAVYLQPAIAANARYLDRCVGGQAYQFLANRSGGLGSITGTNGSDYMLDARGVLNVLNVPDGGRGLGLANRSETALQKTDLFKSADRRGDGGQALREAFLGRIHGFNTFRSANTPGITGGTTTATTTTTSTSSAGGLVVNATAVTNLNPGQYYTVAGDLTPLRVASVATLAVTNTRPLLNDIANGAVITPMALAAINQGSAIPAGDTTLAAASGYPAGWMGKIEIDGTGVPKVGQLVSFRAAGSTVHPTEYCIVAVEAGSNYKIQLDQPLDVALLDNDIVCLGPNGDYNFAFQREAVALVNRPLIIPEAGIGVRAGSARFANMSLRVTMAYDSSKQGTRVVVDGLFGIKVLDVARGAVMLG